MLFRSKKHKHKQTQNSPSTTPNPLSTNPNPPSTAPNPPSTNPNPPSTTQNHQCSLPSFSGEKLLMQSDLDHSDPGLQRHRSLSPRSSSFFQRNPLFPSFSPHQERTLICCPTNLGPSTAPRPHADVHRDNPKSQIDHHQNPNCNLHVSLLKTQTQISHAPPQIKTQTHRLASPATDRRCWRWVWLRWREGDFCPSGSSTCRNMIGHV